MKLLELVQQRHLGWVDPLPRPLEREPLGPVDLGDLDLPTRSWRPLERDGVAANLGRVKVPGQCPGPHHLPGLLTSLPEIEDLALRVGLPQLFCKFPRGPLERTLAGHSRPLVDR